MLNSAAAGETFNADVDIHICDVAMKFDDPGIMARQHLNQAAALTAMLASRTNRRARCFSETREEGHARVAETFNNRYRIATSSTREACNTVGVLWPVSDELTLNNLRLEAHKELYEPTIR